MCHYFLQIAVAMHANFEMSHVMIEKKIALPYANNKGADQTTHPRSLISAIIVHFLDSVKPVFSISKISKLKLVSVAEQAGLSLTLSQTPKAGFSWRGSNSLLPARTETLSFEQDSFIDVLHY